MWAQLSPLDLIMAGTLALRTHASTPSRQTPLPRVTNSSRSSQHKRHTPRQELVGSSTKKACVKSADDPDLAHLSPLQLIDVGRQRCAMKTDSLSGMSRKRNADIVGDNPPKRVRTALHAGTPCYHGNWTTISPSVSRSTDTVSTRGNEDRRTSRAGLRTTYDRSPYDPSNAPHSSNPLHPRGTGGGSLVVGPGFPPECTLSAGAAIQAGPGGAMDTATAGHYASAMALTASHPAGAVPLPPAGAPPRMRVGGAR